MVDTVDIYIVDTVPRAAHSHRHVTGRYPRPRP